MLLYRHRASQSHGILLAMGIRTRFNGFMQWNICKQAGDIERRHEHVGRAEIATVGGVGKGKRFLDLIRAIQHSYWLEDIY